jgi:hypothetical protein
MPLDPSELQRLPENSGLLLDREGRFWHEGAPVEHPKVAAAFRRGLGRAPDGRPTVAFGRTWAYLEVEDTLYRVKRAWCDADASSERLGSCLLKLDDDTEEPLSLGPDSVAVDGEGVLYVRVKDGREWARCLPDAHGPLGRFVEPDGVGLVLRSSAGDLPIGSR